jgi:lipid-binding SYLF domain-containing protein
MKNRTIIQFIAMSLFLTASCLVVSAQDKSTQKLKDAAEESAKSAETLREIMGIPEKAIPQKVFEAAECVAVFPSTIKGGLIVGARKGEGVVSCRVAGGWSAPVFLDLAGGSIGAQIGAQSTDFVFLFMNRSGVDAMVSNKLTLGGEASVAAGPVGREAGASTDWKLNAQILSYSRSKGLFAGVELKGVAITIDDSDMKDVYGEGIAVKEVLTGGRTAPPEVQPFANELSRHASPK